jgi:hypothetical protein
VKCEAPLKYLRKKLSSVVSPQALSSVVSPQELSSVVSPQALSSVVSPQELSSVVSPQNSILGEIRQNSILLLLFYEELSEPPLTTRGYWQIPLKSKEQKELKTRSSAPRIEFCRISPRIEFCRISPRIEFCRISPRIEFCRISPSMLVYFPEPIWCLVSVGSVIKLMISRSLGLT